MLIIRPKLSQALDNLSTLFSISSTDMLLGAQSSAKLISRIIFVTRHAKMRRFSKIMVACFIAYLDRADSDGYNDSSMLLIVTLFPEIHVFECRKCKMY